MLKLKYGNTNTYFVQGNKCGLLVDTDYAGTLPAFYKEMKKAGIRVSDLSYVLATHYHPDHMGIIGELMKQRVELLLLEEQREMVHFWDYIFEKERLPFTPISEESATVISCSESRAFLSSIGISGEIITTPSHSIDSVSLILDDGNCIVGDLTKNGEKEKKKPYFVLLAIDYKEPLKHFKENIQKQGWKMSDLSIESWVQYVTAGNPLPLCKSWSPKCMEIFDVFS